VSLSVTVQHPVDAASATSMVELPAEVFDVQTNIALIHQVVVAQLAAARQGTHSTKTRGEVAGGGRKPYRQKGTGRARQGSNRAPQFAGGGIVHGPQPRSYDQRTPKKMKAAALRGALSDRARNDRVHVVSSIVSGDIPSTRTAAQALATVVESQHILVVAGRDDELTWKSLRNVPSVHLLEPGQLNTYDVLISDDVVFTEAALTIFLGGPPPSTPVTVVPDAAAVDDAVAPQDAVVADDVAAPASDPEAVSDAAAVDDVAATAGSEAAGGDDPAVPADDDGAKEEDS
jgi:large subunit ribosomal protein L4